MSDDELKLATAFLALDLMMPDFELTPKKKWKEEEVLQEIKDQTAQEKILEWCAQMEKKLAEGKEASNVTISVARSKYPHAVATPGLKILNSRGYCCFLELANATTVSFGIRPTSTF